LELGISNGGNLGDVLAIVAFDMEKLELLNDVGSSDCADCTNTLVEIADMSKIDSKIIVSFFLIIFSPPEKFVYFSTVSQLETTNIYCFLLLQIQFR
jgi:hypothetical protein